MKQIKVTVIGHRLERIYGQEEKIRGWFNDQFRKLLNEYDKVKLICGMAQGVDQIAALAALENGIQVLCYFPYKHKLRGVEEYIAEHAAEVRYMCDKYQNQCYFKRDRRMVDDCDILLVVWDGKPWGGTYYTYNYAVEENKPMIRYDWMEENDEYNYYFSNDIEDDDNENIDFD